MTDLEKQSRIALLATLASHILTAMYVRELSRSEPLSAQRLDMMIDGAMATAVLLERKAIEEVLR